MKEDGIDAVRCANAPYRMNNWRFVSCYNILPHQLTFLHPKRTTSLGCRNFEIYSGLETVR